MPCRTMIEPRCPTSSRPMPQPPRATDSSFGPFDELPPAGDRTVASLQDELICMLRRDARDFDAGKYDRCLVNAERVLVLRKVIRALDPKASLYWTFRT